MPLEDIQEKEMKGNTSIDLIFPARTRRPSLVTGTHSFSSSRFGPRLPRPRPPLPLSPPLPLPPNPPLVGAAAAGAGAASAILKCYGIQADTNELNEEPEIGLIEVG